MIKSELSYGSHVLIGSQVEAEYTESSSAMFRHNAFIEALPEAFNDEDAAAAMERLPAYSEEIRRLPACERVQEVLKVANCIVVLPEHLMLSQKFHRLLCNGYMKRNPLSAELRKQIKSAFPTIKENVGKYKLTPLIRSPAVGSSIIGPSGIGKSTLAECIVSMYPQVIIHHDYNGQILEHKQLVWLKLNCPHGGSAKGLCTSFFYAVDRILGTDYANRYVKKGMSADQLLPLMAMVAGEGGLGVLIVDEIHRLKQPTKGKETDLLAFFEDLTGLIGVPVIYIGTFKAMELLGTEVASGRRADGFGNNIFHNTAKDECWDLLLSQIWRYQFTNIPTPLTPALNAAMYTESQGVVDFAVKIYMLAQWEVIGTDNERITAAIIKKVARENLNFVQPYLEALRTKNHDVLKRFKDSYLAKDVLTQAIEKAGQRTMLFGTVDTLQNRIAASRKSDAEIGDSPDDRLVLLLVNAGYDRDTAIKCSRLACGRFAAETDLKLASAEAFRLAAEEVSIQEEELAKKAELKKTSQPSREKRMKPVSLSGDLREIIRKAPKGMPPYEALLDAGVIKSALEFFPQESQA